MVIKRGRISEACTKKSTLLVKGEDITAEILTGIPSIIVISKVLNSMLDL